MNHIIGQHIMIGVSGHSLTSDEKKFITENNISGVTLFGRNVDNPKQIRDLCAEIQSLRHQMPDKAPLIIAIDMEGGRVARLKAPFTQWPPLKKLGDLDSPTMSFYFAYYMGLELKSVGINLDFAPCVDVFTNPQNIIIGDRSISTDPDMVSKHASALIRGYMKAGVMTCAKHFPGHGNTLIDSHEDLPVEEIDLERLQKIEIEPFKKAFKARVDMVMTAHILYKNIDPNWPATLSEIFLKKMIKEDCRYRGIIITDDLDMKAMAKHYDKEQIPVRALQAGADMLLYCNEPESPPIAIDSIFKAIAEGQISKAQLEAGHKKILEFKKERMENPDPVDFTEAAKVIGHPDHFKLSQAVRDGQILKLQT